MLILPLWKILLGGWTNPFEKYYIVKMGLSSPKDRGENKQYLKQPPTSFFQVTLWYPKWRARFHPWKGHLKHPKRSRTEEPGRKLQDEKKGLNRWWSPTSFSAPQRPRTFEEEAYRIATFFSQTSRPSRQRHRSFKYKVDSKKVRFFFGENRGDFPWFN